MHTRPTHRAIEVRACLLDLLADVATLAAQVKDTGTDLLPPQIEALDKLVEAAKECRDNFGGAK
jgi:hypothetical protein